ncbi:hypothetical protein B0H66DRAFT_558566 [Apodospora peruviana]|uniref:Uncharacterized protein n=1 Tax=Apodospora peruviana TaxID=516989 RepID=A0AAE0I5T1_9PEZI|nr:hypothetical protein B0H66DRAFT_558566 [Apodospora peruviana]
MPIQPSAVISIFEVIASSGLQGTLELAKTIPGRLISTFLSYFVVQYGALKFYRIAIYPGFGSPLRNTFSAQLMDLFKAASPIDLPVKWSNT